MKTFSFLVIRPNILAELGVQRVISFIYSRIFLEQLGAMTTFTPRARHTTTSADQRYHHPTYYQTPPAHRYEQQTKRSPFPRDGTPTPTIRGKPEAPFQSHYHRTVFTESACPYYEKTQTYAWVLEQEDILKERSKQDKTQKWVFEQRSQSPGSTLQGKDDFPQAWEEKTRGQMWEELVYAYELESDRWRRQEEENKRLAEMREKAKARYIQEELRRLEARIRSKREAERQRMVEERLRVQMEIRERDQKERGRTQKAIADAWQRYENGWEALANSTTPLCFADIPWLTKSLPKESADITPSAVVGLLLSPFHSPKQTRKERIRSAQLRWHPDRFLRLIHRVKEEDRKAVEEGVGIIARCLNDLMSREKTTTRSVSVYMISRCDIGLIGAGMIARTGSLFVRKAKICICAKNYHQSHSFDETSRERVVELCLSCKICKTTLGFSSRCLSLLYSKVDGFRHGLGQKKLTKCAWSFRNFFTYLGSRPRRAGCWPVSRVFRFADAFTHRLRVPNKQNSCGRPSGYRRLQLHSSSPSHFRTPLGWTVLQNPGVRFFSNNLAIYLALIVFPFSCTKTDHLIRRSSFWVITTVGIYTRNPPSKF